VTAQPFSGSYRPNDVSFLLTRIDMKPMCDLDEKERLIQSGERHYSELISMERQPSTEYLRLFQHAAETNIPRMARDLVRVARTIVERRPRGFVLVSLARAGTPVGVALKRLYGECMGIDVPHYSISIIRDRGIDAAALDYISERHDPTSIVFIDGWTGKGAITTELHRSIPSYNKSRGVAIPPELYVLTDLAGTSCGCGSTDDYLIPSSILNATVSGLVSRTILNECVGRGDFHGCLYYDHLESQDLSQWFIDQLISAVHVRFAADSAEPVPIADLSAAANRSARVLQFLMTNFDVGDRNYIKPGIGEATRSLLRRAPRLVCLNAPDDPETMHLRVLAEERGVPIQIVPTLPLKAAALIKKLGHA
jgi:hypothetical protein